MCRAHLNLSLIYIKPKFNQLTNTSLKLGLYVKLIKLILNNMLNIIKKFKLN